MHSGYKLKGKPRKGPTLGHSGKSALNAVNKNTGVGAKSNGPERKEPTIKEKVIEDDDEELNSGFGTYIRSSEGIEMMKLFVMANSIVIILTMAWPNMQKLYSMFEDWWFYQTL